MNRPQMIDFLSSHSSPEIVISIRIEPEPIYIEEGRDANYLNFDFILRGLTKKNLHLRFFKAAVYDTANNLVHYKYLNHNAVGIPGIYTIGKIDLQGIEEFDIPNPFTGFQKICQSSIFVICSLSLISRLGKNITMGISW